MNTTRILPRIACLLLLASATLFATSAKPVSVPPASVAAPAPTAVASQPSSPNPSSFNFLEEVQTYSSRLSALSVVILFEIEDADQEQLEAFQRYSSDYGKAMAQFGALLGQSNTLMADLRKQFSDAKVADLRKVIAEMGAVVSSLQATNKAIRGQIYDD